MGKRCIGLRTDLNSNTSGNELEDTVRIDKYIPYLRSVSEDFKTVYLMSHQGRRGGDNFISLRPHSNYIRNNTDLEVLFCPKDQVDRYPRYSNVDSDIVVIDNIRFFRSETEGYQNPIDATKTKLIDKLSRYFSIYMNDAFSVSHRSHASIVGFPVVMESTIGPLFREEVESMGNGFWESDRRCCIIGGSKLRDKCKYIYNFIKHGNVETILTTGEVSNVFLDRLGYEVAKDYNEELPEEIIEKVDYSLEHEDILSYPTDVAVDRYKRERKHITELEDDNPLDIGYSTMRSYKSEIERSGSVLMAGPAGMYERDGFRNGTKTILEQVASHDSGIIAGGDTILSAEDIGVSGFMHKSYGGGSTLHYLSEGSVLGLSCLRREF